MNEIPGLVISSIDYKEKSKIVYLYTPYGHDSVRANHSKDMKKGLLGFTTTLNQVSYIKTNAKFPTLIEYNLVKTNFDLASSIKNIKLKSINDIKRLLSKKVHLDLWVKVKKDWKDRPNDLRVLGYSTDNF